MSWWRASRPEISFRHLFRPESVASSHEVSRETKTVVDTGTVIAVGYLVAALVASRKETTTSAETEITYTVSASLVDMRNGKLLKVGVHSGSGSRTEKRNLGFAEPPPAAPILEAIMTDLGESVLEE